MAYASPFVDDLVRQTVPEDVANLALHPSRRVLVELYGLEVASPPPYIARAICFTAPGVESDAELIRELTLIAKTLLIPVGEYPSLAWILLGANGMLLTLGWVAPGVYLLGNTFGAGLEAYFWQKKWTPVYFEPTIRKDFRFPDVSADDPTAHRFE